MSAKTNHLLDRCRLMESVVLLSLKVGELEQELLRRDVKRLEKRQRKRRRLLLGRLAELDQIRARIE